MKILDSILQRADEAASQTYIINANHGGRLLDRSIAGFETIHHHTDLDAAKKHAEKIFSEHKSNYKHAKSSKKKNFSVTVHSINKQTHQAEVHHLVDHEGIHTGAAANTRQLSHHRQD